MDLSSTPDRSKADLDCLRKMAKDVAEVIGYISNNKSHMVNYVERSLAGERLRAGFVELTVNQVISKRFIKKPSMDWTSVLDILG